MPYRARQLLLNAITAGPLFIGAVLTARWVLAVDDGDTASILLRALPGLAAATAAALLHHWPTRRRPARLYHLTSAAAATAATVAAHADGTVTVQLRARRPGHPVHLFPAPPRRRSVVLWNLKADPEVCIELHHLAYDNVRVRRRITGAYALRGPVAATAIVHPFPPEPR